MHQKKKVRKRERVGGGRKERERNGKSDLFCYGFVQVFKVLQNWVIRGFTQTVLGRHTRQLSSEWFGNC